MDHVLKRNVRDGRVLTEAEAAYIAGVVDGEGTIGLMAQRGRKGKVHTCVAHLSVSNTFYGLMEWLVETTGHGSIGRQKQTERCKICYRWHVSPAQVREILPQIEPYLVVKKAQAAVVLRYLALIDSHLGVPLDEIEEAAALVGEIRRLNARGVDPERDAELQAEYGKKPCAEPDCPNRRYPKQDYCYQHWLKNRVAETGRCKYCGGEMALLYHKEKLFCSPECRSKQFYQDKVLPTVAAEVETREAKPCPACEKPVDRKHYARKIYCDDHCREVVRARAKKRPEGYTEERICRHCGKPFASKWGKQVHCSSTCVKAAYRRRLQNE